MKNFLFVTVLGAFFAAALTFVFAEDPLNITGTWEQIGNGCDNKGVCESMNDSDIFWQFRADKKAIFSYHYKITGNTVIGRTSPEAFDILDFFKGGSICLRSQKSQKKKHADINLLYWHHYQQEKNRIVFKDYDNRVINYAEIMLLEPKVMLIRVKGSGEIVKFIRNEK